MIKVIAGPVNSGKTKRLDEITSCMENVDGVISVKEMLGSNVMCFRAKRIKNGESKLFLYHERSDYKEDYIFEIGPYRVVGDTFNWILEFVTEAISKENVIALDEVGVLELRGAGYHKLINKIIDSGNDFIFTCRNDLAGEIKKEFCIEEWVMEKVVYDKAIIGGSVYLNGELKHKNIYINGEKIAFISDEVFEAKRVIDAKGKKVFPGIIDPHVHFELPLAITSRDDFYSGSLSGAFGGVTTYIDFLDPIGKGDELEEAFNTRNALAKKSITDYGFHTTVKNPVGEIKNITTKMKKYGLRSVKLFTTYSDSGRRTFDNEIVELLNLSGEHFIVLAHVENDEMIKVSDDLYPKDLPTSRPEESETSEALHLASLVADNGGRLYMVHTTSGNTIDKLKEKYSDILGKNFFIESCPQYFTLDDSLLAREDGYLYSCAPPIRNKKAQERLKANIDTVSTIGTDHCSFLKEDKVGKSLAKISLGLGSIENSFPIMYTLFGLKIVDKMTSNTAKIFGIYPKKGVISVGSDADLFLYDDSVTRVINSNDHSKSDYTPYEGLEVKGEVVTTIRRGEIIVLDKKLQEVSSGKYIFK